MRYIYTMSHAKAYILSLNPLDSAKGKWDYGLLEEAFIRNHVEEIVVNEIPEDDRAFVVIPGGGNAGKEKEISKEISKINRVVLFITADECSLFDVDKIKHPNIEIWVQTPGFNHKNYNKLFLGAPQHLKNNLPEYPNKKYYAYFGGQVTHQRRQELATIMSTMSNVLYCPTEGFAQGDEPREYLAKMASSKIAPAPSGAVTIDSFRFYEAIEMLALPITDRKNSQGIEIDYYDYVYGQSTGIPSTNDWTKLPEIIEEIMKDYPANLHRIVAWWIKYKRDFSYKIVEQLYAS